VVWPENSTAVDPFTDGEANDGIVTAADAVRVPILVGAMADDPADDQQVLNQGIVWQPGLGGGDRYTKWHPVPYGEYIPFRGSIIPDTYGQLRRVSRDMARGTRREPLRIAGVPVADAICFDIAYDDVVSAQVRQGAELVTVQTSNAMFVETGQIDQQFEISRLRALEADRWVVVAAINGVSGIIDPTGRAVASAGARTQAVLVEAAGLRRGVTPASWMGLWPGRVVLGLVAVHAVVLLWSYRRSRRRGTQAVAAPRQKVAV
jgi:apolipoprotein N-acyltransferase